jgi:hypothetical protein
MATGPTAGADVSGIIGDFTLSLRVATFSATAGQASARIVIEETTNGFVSSVPVAVVDIQGPVVGTGRHTWRKYQIFLSMVGNSGAQLRANVYYLLPGFGSTASLQFESWIDS